MCGIVGMGSFWSAGVDQPERNAFYNMLIADTVRGTDGTGIMLMTDKGKVHTMKEVGTPFNLFWKKGFKKHIEDPFAKEHIRFAVGHNRSATRGTINANNAHPFQVGNITMVHNGTAEDATKSAMPNFSKFEVDSHAFTASIDKYGLDKTLKDHWRGPYAIVFFDAKEQTMNLARNYGRPLALAYDEGSSRLMFASEMGLLRWVIDRNKWKTTQMFELETNELYTFAMEKRGFTKRKLPTPVYGSYHYPAKSYGGFGWQLGLDDDSEIETPASQLKPSMATPPGDNFHRTGSVKPSYAPTGYTMAQGDWIYDYTTNSWTWRMLPNNSALILPDPPKQPVTNYSEFQYPKSTTQDTTPTDMRPVHKPRIIQLESYEGFKKGDELKFDLYDWRSEAKDGGTVLVGGREGWADVEIRHVLKNPDQLEEIQLANELGGIIMSMNRRTDLTEVDRKILPAIVIYVSNLRMIFYKDKKTDTTTPRTIDQVPEEVLTPEDRAATEALLEKKHNLIVVH